MRKHSSSIEGAAVVLILMVGLIHLIDAPGSFGDATYKGVLFLVNAAGAVVAAVGIRGGSWTYGWALGLIVAAGAFVAYVISRTVGLPGIPPDDWFEEIGLLSLVVEAAFVGIFLRASSELPGTNTKSETNS